MYQTRSSVYTLIPVSRRRLLENVAVLGSLSLSDSMKVLGILCVQHDVNSIVFRNEKK